MTTPSSANDVSGRSFWRRRGRSILIFGLAAVLFGCNGYLTPTTDIGTTTATLTAQAQCSADTPSNPCTYWFQYWADGAASTTSTSRTSITSAYTGAAGFDLTGLQPGTLYHNIFCGYGDSNIPANGWWCRGPNSAGQAYYTAKLLCQNQASADCKALLKAADLSQAGAFRTGAPAGGGLPATTGTADIGRVLSTADLPSSPIQRDSGQSVQYATGQALWLFGDTQQYTPGGTSFLGGTTAAFGAFTQGQAPQMLDEVPPPGTALTTGRTAPTPFLPNSTTLKVPGMATPCTGSQYYSPSWSAGALLEDSGKVLITLGEVCVKIGAFGGVDEGFGVIEWDPATNSFTNGSTINTVFKNTNGLPDRENLGHPVLGPQGGYVYLYSSDANGVYIVRVPAAQAASATSVSYQFWNGTAGTWVAAAQYAQATSLISLPSGITPTGLSVGDFSGTTTHNYVMLVSGITAAGTSAMVVYSAPIPTGPWTRGPTVVMPDACVSFCYAMEGHPELSFDGTFVYSYYSTDDRSGDGTAQDGYAQRHIRLGTIDW